MSTPGGYGGYGQDPNQQFDPFTGQPLPPNQTAAYPAPDTGGYQGLGQYPPTSAYPSQFPTGGFPQAPPPPPPKRTGLIIGIIAAVVVIAVGATLAIVLLNKGDSQASGGSTPATTTSAPPPTTTAPTTTTSTPDGGGGATYSGWQTVNVPAEQVSYDVPPDWKVESGTDANVTIPQSRAAVITNVSTYKTGACPGEDGSFRAKVGLAAPSSGDKPDTAAKKVAQTWADALAKIYHGKSATPTTSQQAVNQGQTKATLAVVLITTTKDSCNPPNMLVAVVSFPSGSRTESLVLFGDQNVPDAITSDLVAKVLLTARPTQ